jgi:imidazoleglycerol-phosphate dehydratase
MGLERERLGELACENVPHIFQSFAANARASVHVDVLRGENDHHRVESAFKAFALALRRAVRQGESDEIPSTKGVL